MNKTKIEWADYTWNPIKGACPVGCWYCYARRMYQRFGWDPGISYDYAPLEKYGKINSGSRIFVCSTFELFHPVADKWRDFIFSAIKRSPEQTFIVLTKMPERIDRPMPDNVWLGVSVTGGNQEALDRIASLYGAKARIKFVSMEPLLDSPSAPVLDFLTRWGRVDWLIVGRLTGHGSAHDPVPQGLGRLGTKMCEAGIPVFVKNNLAGIWPGKLIQEWPR